MSAGRVAVIGDLINDIVAVTEAEVRVDTDTTASITFAAGGSAANSAAWLASVGVEVDLVAAVGAQDAATHEAELRAGGVTPHLQVEQSTPTGTIIIVAHEQQRTMLTQRGANSLLRSASLTDEVIAGADLVHLSGYSIVGAFGVEGGRDVIRRATDAGVPVSVNPASIGFIRDFGVERLLDAIRGTSLLFLSTDEAQLLTGLDDEFAQARALGAQYPVVALTRGARGVIVVVDGGEPVEVPAVQVTSVDPTGAGDAFIAGFLAHWLRDPDAVAAAVAGTQVAARAVTSVGGRPV